MCVWIVLVRVVWCNWLCGVLIMVFILEDEEFMNTCDGVWCGMVW
jgi:hypothetical protein